jgi:hypothetical protein
MTTDEQILELVATGKFTLSQGLRVPSSDRRPGEINWYYNTSYFGGSPIHDQHAHDLCAMHFARETGPHGSFRTNWKLKTWDAISTALLVGDSAAAIKALYDAVIGAEELA